jgi:hypothetical protein
LTPKHSIPPALGISLPLVGLPLFVAGAEAVQAVVATIPTVVAAVVAAVFLKSCLAWLLFQVRYRSLSGRVVLLSLLRAMATMAGRQHLEVLLRPEVALVAQGLTLRAKAAAVADHFLRQAELVGGLQPMTYLQRFLFLTVCISIIREALRCLTVMF